MIVTCAECDTHFKLDDSKIVGTGLNVRCSVCKYAFFVEARGSEVEGDANEPASAIDRIAGAAIDAALSGEPGSIPEATQDLAVSDSESSSDEDEIIQAADLPDDAAEGIRESGESDWEFSLDPATEAGATTRNPAAGNPGASLSAVAERAVDDLLDPAPTPGVAEAENGLGAPEDWDFFGNEGENLSADPPQPAPVAEPAQVVPPAGAAAIARAEGSGALQQPQGPGVSPEAFGAELSYGVKTSADLQSSFPEHGPARLAPRALARAGNAIGWFFVIALLALGVQSGVQIQRMTPAHLETQRVGGALVESVDGQWIENIFAGPLFVVSGTLRAAGDSAVASRSVIVLRLYDAAGQPLDSASAMVGPALSEQQIREGGPEELIARLELGASRISSEPLASGETRRFNAILREVPMAAVSFRLESAPLSLDVP